MKCYFIATLVLAFALGSDHQAHAIAPRHVSDQELAEHPIIVVAKWDKAPAKSHNQYRQHNRLGRVVIKSEVYTSLNVLEVVKGPIKPGNHELMIGWGITWQTDGTNLRTGTSTDILGDVDDVTKPCLWFLKRTRSWDKTRKSNYLTVSNYREIQPIALREFFIAMGTSDRATQVPKLLNSSNPSVVVRVIHYICGDDSPCQLGTHFIHRPADWKRDRAPLPTHAAAIKVLLARDDPIVRGVAAWAYADLLGKRSLPAMAELLSHQDNYVRAVAVAALAKHDAIDAIPDIERVVGRIQGWPGREVVDVLAEWGDERVVPVLIRMLQTSAETDCPHITPALHAREALKQMVGYEFPFDVRRSLSAWQKVKLVRGKTTRNIRLAELLQHDPAPLRAEIIGDKSNPRVKITNVSANAVELSEYPDDFKQEYTTKNTAGSSFGGVLMPSQGVITLQPGDSLLARVELLDGLLLAEPDDRKLSIEYYSNGRPLTGQTFVGEVRVVFGEEWKEKRYRTWRLRSEQLRQVEVP